MVVAVGTTPIAKTLQRLAQARGLSEAAMRSEAGAPFLRIAKAAGFVKRSAEGDALELSMPGTFGLTVARKQADVP